MVNVILIVLLAALIGWAVYRVVQRNRKGSACCGEHETAVKRIPVQDRDKRHYPFKISLSIGGMTCENCAIRVENALNALPGTWAKVDIAEKKAQVLLKEEPDEHEIRQAVSGVGYSILSYSTEN